jgi:hypothetical protein
MVLTMGERTCAVVTFALVLASAWSLPAEVAPPLSDDATSTHDFADVRYWSSVFDDPARDAWQKPKELVAALDIRRGSVVDPLQRRLRARSVPTARCSPRDGAEPSRTSGRRAAGEKTPTAPRPASPADLRLPPAGRLILIVDTYHHIDDRRIYVPACPPLPGPDGRRRRDWQKRELPVGPPMDHKLAREQVVDEMQASGFTLAAEHTILPYQYFLVFAQAEPRDSPGTPTR